MSWCTSGVGLQVLPFIHNRHFGDGAFIASSDILVIFVSIERNNEKWYTLLGDLNLGYNLFIQLLMVYCLREHINIHFSELYHLIYSFSICRGVCLVTFGAYQEHVDIL